MQAALLLPLLLSWSWAPTKITQMTAAQKIDLIEKGKLPPGSQITFRESELNVYLDQKARELVPEGLKNPRIVIRDGKVTATARVDFVKMRHAQGLDTGWMMRKLLEGEHPVQVVGALRSGNGIARVDLELVDIGGVSIRGRALDLLIRTFVHPLYPNVKVGESFELGYDLDRIELKPGIATVFTVSKPPKRAVASR
ncbi:MAG: hypothetical protein NZV14_02865 [Bryobacteraceae bacterium]|nr:hypothetical protein [Bryobacteraceae bacterium]MDW8377075.1 hypothetical protein [Bryobacterales bacterium]